jgi:hypothetical protein
MALYTWLEFNLLFEIISNPVVGLVPSGKGS